jgi:flavodoxin
MDALVIYDTRFDNTRQVAEAIAAGLDEGYDVTVTPVAGMTAIPESIDLLVVGGPTHAHGQSHEMRDFLDSLPRGALHGVPALAFDTRYRMSRLLTGSAALRIAKKLEQLGARLAAPPESFFVTRDTPPHLEDGELERARVWATGVVAASLIAV